MSAEQAFADFVAAWERGEQRDPAAAIGSVGEADREPLAAMLATFLAANRPDVSEAVVDARAAEPASEPPRPWAELLPGLRERIGLTRGALVTRLAGLLGHPEAQSQVGGYVHELETGLLAPTGVRQPVVAALAKILDVPESLLELSRRLVPPPAAESDVLALYRKAPPAATPAAAQPIDIEAVRQALPERNAQIDDLFTGADG